MNPIERLTRVFRNEPVKVVSEPQIEVKKNVQPQEEFHYYSRLQLMTPEEAEQRMGLMVDAPFLIQVVEGDGDKELAAIYRIGEEVRTDYFDSRSSLGGFQVFRVSKPEDICRVDSECCDAVRQVHARIPFSMPMGIYPVEDLSHWYARVEVGKMFFMNHEREAYFESLKPMEFVQVCYEHHQSIKSGIVVELTDEASDVHFIEGLLVPICSLDVHPEYYDRAKYIFETDEKGEIRFRVIAQLISDKENAPTTI